MDTMEQRSFTGSTDVPISFSGSINELIRVLDDLKRLLKPLEDQPHYDFDQTIHAMIDTDMVRVEKNAEIQRLQRVNTALRDANASLHLGLKKAWEERDLAVLEANRLYDALEELRVTSFQQQVHASFRNAAERLGSAPRDCW